MTISYYFSKLKKISASLLVFGLLFSTSTVLFRSSVYALPNSCPSDLKLGDEIKVSGKPAIYVLDRDLKPRYFFSGYVYKSFKTSYGGYKTVTQECLLGLGQPSKAPFGVTYRPGSYIVKRSGESQLYAVLPGNALAKISETTARSLYGSSYASITLDDREWSDYICKKADITSTKVFPGMTFKVSGDSKVWYMDSQNRLHEVSDSALSSNYIVSQFVPVVQSSATDGLTKAEIITSGYAELTDRTQSNVDCSGNVTPPPTGNDTSAPTVTITAPQTGATVKDTVSYSANASDNVGVTKVQFLVDNSVVSEDTSAPYSIDWNTKNKSNGNVTLQAKAYDAAGNSTLSPSITVKIDNATNPPAEMGTLKVELVNDPSEITLLMPNEYGTVFTFKLVAEKEAVQLRKLKISWSGTQLIKDDLKNLALFTNKPNVNDTPLIINNTPNIVCTGNTTCSLEFTNSENLLPSEIKPGSPVTIYVRGYAGEKGKARVGDVFSMSVNTNDINGYGLTNKKDVQVLAGWNNQSNQTIINNNQVQIIPWNVLSTDPFTNDNVLEITSSSKDVAVYLLKTFNHGTGPSYINSIKFNDLGSHSDDVLYNLYATKNVDPTSVFKFDGSVDITKVDVLAVNRKLDDFNTLNYRIDADKMAYFILSIKNVGSSKIDDRWSIQPLPGFIRYSVNESDLGYDNNGDGQKNALINNISSVTSFKFPQKIKIVR